MSLIFATQLTAVATIALAVLALCRACDLLSRPERPRQGVSDSLHLPRLSWPP